MLSESRRILYEFLVIDLSLKKPPERRSNKTFRGYVFSKIFAEHLKPHLKFGEIVVGPLWIQELEWIEWDCAIVREGAKRLHGINWFLPDDIIALFECKVSGIYGSRNELPDMFNRINHNFEEAKEICENLKECLYVSLMEVKPKKKGINYYEETKKHIKNAFILFNSRSVDALKAKHKDPKEIASKAEEYEGEWESLIRTISNSNG
ncbi:MAG: hypothetical protein ACTSUJ_00845 [Candidatus Njordarchaeales archaeon]